MNSARVIKKYPNRRLYDTVESCYITLADVRALVIRKIDFVVMDKKSGDDITRSILLQVITEQEQQGEAAMSQDFLSQVIRSYAIGDTITLSGIRNDEPFEATLILGAHPDLEGAPMVGVVFDTVNLSLDLPVDVQVDSQNIGGPSAGLTYALTVIDLLTADDLTKGHVIAATGTIRFDGTVGAIGGVRQKVYAARAIGAEIVFVPTNNYDDALTAAGDEIEIVSVATLQDALDRLDELSPASLVAASG